MDQAYRLKSVTYRGRDCQILLQNENGPCPLLAAANALLLLGRVKLPPSAVRNNVASLSDLTNVLANYVLQCSSTTAEDSHFFFDELLRLIPKLQYGMDVNPKFTAGIMGYEYTQELTCFDLWHVKLVHGWLLDPTSEENAATFDVIGNKTYNELIEVVIIGREAELKKLETMQRLEELRQQHELLSSAQSNISNPSSTEEETEKQQPSSKESTGPSPSTPMNISNESSKGEESDMHVEQELASSKDLLIEIAELEQQLEKLQIDSTRASCIDYFLETTGHQLTHYGLTCLHEGLEEDELTVFFRNNHFATLTKHDGSLFLLVTDLGYANTPMVVWERLDVIDGDTEYVNSQFQAPGQITQSGSSLTPEQLMAQSSQNDADYHLALQLSGQPSDANISQTSQAMLDTEEGKLMAAATEASLREYHVLQASVEGTSSGETSTQLLNQHVLAPQETVPLGHTAMAGDPLEIAVPPSQDSVPPNIQTGETLVSGGEGQVTPLALTYNTSNDTHAATQEAADALLAQQLARELMQEEQLQQLDPDDDWRLARQLQDEEERAAAEQRTGQTSNAATTHPTNSTATPTTGQSSTSNNYQQQDSTNNSRCVIS